MCKRPFFDGREMKITLLSLLLICISCSGDKKEKQVIEGQTMGTYYRVILYGDKPAAEIKADIDKFLELFNNIFSTYIPESEISKVNNTKFDKIKISDSLHKAISVSLEIAHKSQGYFDPTVGPLVNAWGFGPDGKKQRPTSEEIKSLLDKVGYQHIHIKNKYLHFAKKNMYIDLSAMAKGFGVDELVKHLSYQGYENLLVEIGGEVRARGTKPDGSSWRIGVEGPTEQLGGKLAQVVELKNMSMATSGSYRNYKKYGHEIFQHTIDPKTGKPAGHQTISVSVLDEYCADADAWATALMSMGASQGVDLANNLGIPALFQVKTNDEKISQISTTAWEDYIKENQR